jgi:hypothetical protein
VVEEGGKVNVGLDFRRVNADVSSPECLYLRREVSCQQRAVVQVVDREEKASGMSWACKDILGPLPGVIRVLIAKVNGGVAAGEAPWRRGRRQAGGCLQSKG